MKNRGVETRRSAPPPRERKTGTRTMKIPLETNLKRCVRQWLSGPFRWLTIRKPAYDPTRPIPLFRPSCAKTIETRWGKARRDWVRPMLHIAIGWAHFFFLRPSNGVKALCHGIGVWFMHGLRSGSERRVPEKSNGNTAVLSWPRTSQPLTQTVAQWLRVRFGNPLLRFRRLTKIKKYERPARRGGLKELKKPYGF